ncbi:MAG: rhomboid family intramembrane serine protease, partial [Deltaproteobacteria bacterium]|nr:rhomboid family intramembrane serine protease [Deltaproteobacteria bacterium]
MPREGAFDAPPGLTLPGPAVRGVMGVLFAVWLGFAVFVNWAGGSQDAFLLFCGSTRRILDGEVYRLFTAPLVHLPSGTISHILFALLGLFFFAPELERAWGPGRFLRFFGLSALVAYGVQMAAELALPASLAGRLVGEYWFGAFPALEAVAIAWALSFRGRVVRLWFVLPVSSRGLVGFIVGMSLLRVIADAGSAEGLVSPFGGMLAGWLLGGGTPSPLRRAYLRLRLAQLDRESARGGAGRR